MGKFHIIIVLFLQSAGIDKSELLYFQKKDEVSTLVIYSKRSLNFSSFSLFIDNERVISSFQKNIYYVLEHPPGKISLQTKGLLWRNLTEDKDYSLTLEAGKTYYLEALVEYQVLMTSIHLVRRSSEVGEREIKNMKGEIITLTTTK